MTCQPIIRHYRITLFRLTITAKGMVLCLKYLLYGTLMVMTASRPAAAIVRATLITEPSENTPFFPAGAEN
jgi:hypothetical protein